MKLVVTIPALNEEKTIAAVVSGVPRDIPGITETEVIVVNDGSTDKTAACAQAAGAIVINLRGRPGLGTVFRTGLERAMRRGADIIVNIDGDGQFDPADIRHVVDPLLRDEADFVTCSRFADPHLTPNMPAVKLWGNGAVTGIINWVCGGTNFTDVSCGFRAFNREAAYRLTLFGRFTYTQECFIDLFSKGLRIAEVPLKVRGVREHGTSRVAGSIWKYARSSLPIILRAMRDIQPLKFFGGIAAALGLSGALTGGFVLIWYLIPHLEHDVSEKGVRFATLVHKTSPFTSLITVSGVLFTLGFLMFAVALLADMLGRHRRITEELLYLTRRRIYSSRRLVRTTTDVAGELESPHSAGVAPTLHDSWSIPALPVIKEIPARSSPEPLPSQDDAPHESVPAPTRSRPASFPARAR
jgi:glycosyltransferase involved in cell wall biosynthesis